MSIFSSIMPLVLMLSAFAPLSRSAEECREKAVRTYMGPGEDGTWGTLDDEIFSIIEFDYDSHGRIVFERTLTGAGVDGLWGTEDDLIGTLAVNGYDELGHKVQSIVYGAPGPDGIWRTVDDEIIYDNRMEYDPFGRLLTERSYGSPGSDAVWGTADDELLAENLHEWKNGREVQVRSRIRDEVTDDVFESRLVYEYDRKGRRTRIIGYQAGPTEVSSAVVASWSELIWDGDRLMRTIEYLEPGYDGKWFTADDVIGSVTAHEYDADGQRTVSILYGDRGPDKTWGTADDVVQHRILTVRECKAMP